MAEVTAFRNNVIPYPIYGVPYTVVFPLLDADGDPVTGATCDSEISLNGDTGADCTNEGTEITFTTATNKGQYYLTLTAAEMTCNIASISIYSATSKATVITLYPRVLPTIRAATAQAGAAGTITLDASAVSIDDYYNGYVLYIHTGTGSGQIRTVTDYAGSTKVATVIPNWATTPDNTSQFYIYQTDSPFSMAQAMRAMNIALPAAPTADSLFERLKTLDDAYTATRAGYLDELASANLPTDVAAIPTAAANADAVWEEAIADHSGTGGSTAEQLAAAAAAGDPWVTEIPGAYGAGSAGKKMADLYQAFTGKWEITGNQLILYDSDNTTALFTYNLTRDGEATEFNPDKREAA